MLVKRELVRFGVCLSTYRQSCMESLERTSLCIPVVDEFSLVMAFRDLNFQFAPFELCGLLFASKTASQLAGKRSSRCERHL